MNHSRLKGPARLLVICAFVFLVSAGLCGLQILSLNRNPGGNDLGGLLMIAGIGELIAMLVSAIIALGALIALIWQRLTRK